MSLIDPLSHRILEGEGDWIASVVADLSDDQRKLVYADWLEDHRDERATFLRSFVAALRSMEPEDFPPDTGLPEEWLELIGYRLASEIAARGVPELKEPAFRVARPALRMLQVTQEDGQIPVGASKIGGLPDLPPEIRWPIGEECTATYNDDTRGVNRLAGFLGQVNLAEVAHTQAAKDLPSRGVLSFFCFQDMENDNPDVIGARVFFFPDPTKLVRTQAPQELTKGNTEMPARTLHFSETLDLPNESSGPWSADFQPYSGRGHGKVYEHFYRLNLWNFLGYARATTGPDPTPNKQSRHLILLENSAGCRLHLQLPQDALAARNFDAVTLNYVDFD